MSYLNFYLKSSKKYLLGKILANLMNQEFERRRAYLIT